MKASFFDSVGPSFSNGDNIPWCDDDFIAVCKSEAAKKEDASDEVKSENLMRLSWALVHSRQPEDVWCGIAVLEDSLSNLKDTLQYRDTLYLLAVGHYRIGDYSMSRVQVDQCLEIFPDWRQALTLKKIIEDRMAEVEVGGSWFGTRIIEDRMAEVEVGGSWFGTRICIAMGFVAFAIARALARMN